MAMHSTGAPVTTKEKKERAYGPPCDLWSAGEQFCLAALF